MYRNNIRIMIIISRFDRCGPNRQLLPIIREMKAQMYEVHILTLFSEKTDSMFQEFNQIGVHIKSAEIASNKNIFRIRKNIKNYLKKWEPDVVYSSGLSANYHMARTVRDRKLYCTLRNNAYAELKYNFGGIVGKVGEYMTDYAVKNIDFVICCSQSLQKVYQKRFPKKNIYCIQNGTDMTQFCYKEKVSNKKSRKVVFLVSGSLDDRKDPVTIIKAFQRAGISEKAELLFIGEGKLKKYCKELAMDDAIKFLGFVEQVDRYYQEADVYVSASYLEGLPNSVLEAGACGCRMILSDIPQHREIFMEADDCISFFEAGNIEELSELFRRNIKITKAEERKRISRYIAANFSSNIMAQKYCDFIRQHAKSGRNVI